MNIKDQTKRIIIGFQIPVAKFCRQVGISSAAYYRWQSGDLKLACKSRFKKAICTEF